jgi:hypothetical protein
MEKLVANQPDSDGAAVGLGLGLPATIGRNGKQRNGEQQIARYCTNYKE